MNWDLVIWGLLLGIGGTIWMMVLALPGKRTDRTTESESGTSHPKGAERIESPIRAA